MKKIANIFCVLLLIVGTLPALQAREAILIKNGTIVPVVGVPIAGGSLLIEKGKITKIGRNIAAPAGAVVIDAAGKYVYPGLVAVMTAVGVTAYPGAKSDINEIGTSTPQMDPYDAINPEDDCIAVTRLGGVTTVQTISGTSSVINGKSVVLHLEGDLADDMVARRNAAQIFNIGAKEQGKYPSTEPGVVAFLREKLNKAREYAERSAKEKGKKDMTLEALIPVIQGKIPALFVTSDEVSIRNALHIIKDYHLKGIIRASTGLLKYAGRIAREKIPVVWAGTTTIPQRWEPYDLNYHTAAVLAEKGVLFAFDPGGWGPGSRNVRNLPVPASISVAHGLAEEEAVKAMTINPAKILGMADEIGSLEVGKTANVVIWSGSPVQLRSRVEKVIIRGRIMPLTSVQTRLYEKFKKIVHERMAKKK